MRKLKIQEMERLSIEEFALAPKIPVVVVLDNIRSMHNVGALFRTSDALRLSGLYLCGITAYPPHPEIHKTALGAEEVVPWSYRQEALEVCQELKEAGYTLWSVEQAQGSTSLSELSEEMTRGKKIALVIGNEVSGVDQAIIDLSDRCIEIPQYGTKHSLNVSVAAGIVLWEVSQKIGKAWD